MTMEARYLTSPGYAALVKETDLALVPLGAVEVYGPHLPLGADGIATFERAHPDLVLLDIRLPDMTGFDVLARIRDANPVVIMITGYGDVALAVPHAREELISELRRRG